jgi:hypothetical protein
LNHYASPAFWACHRALPAEVRELADKSFEFLKANPRHPSVQLKKVRQYYSARVGLHYRALGVEVENGVLWFWIGSHAQYDKLIG